MKPCPACKKDVQDQETMCPYCGVIFEKWAARTARPIPSGAPMLSNPAGFWVRGGALFVDSLVVMVCLIPLDMALKIIQTPQALVFMTNIILGVAYSVWLVGSYGQTVGKMAAGIKIIRDDGGSVDFVQAGVRYLAHYLSGLILMIGYLMAAFDEKKRALHDRLVGTRVVFLPSTTSDRKMAFTILGVLPYVGLAFLFIVLLFVISSKGLSILGNRMKSSATGQTTGTNFSRPGPSDFKNLAGQIGNLGNMGLLRAQIALYYGNKSRYPQNLSEILDPPKFSAIPSLQLDQHPAHNDVQIYDDKVCLPDGKIDGSKLLDTGRWGYISPPSQRCAGTLFVDCTHKGYQNKSWFEW